MPRKRVAIAGDDYGTARVRVWSREGRTTVSVDAFLWRIFVKSRGDETAAREWLSERMRKGAVPAGVTRSTAVQRAMLLEVARPELLDR